MRGLINTEDTPRDDDPPLGCDYLCKGLGNFDAISDGRSRATKAHRAQIQCCRFGPEQVQLLLWTAK
jgi:hypothetical protein